MHIIYYIALQSLILLGTVVVVPMILADDIDRILLAREAIDDDKRDLETHARLKDAMGHFLLISDLVLSGGSSYLAPVAINYAGELEQRLSALEKSPLGKDNPQRCRGLIDEGLILKGFIKSSMTINGPDRLSKLQTLLEQYDRRSEHMLFGIQDLGVQMENVSIERKRHIEDLMSTFWTHAAFGFLGLLAVLLASWYHSMSFLVQPLKRLRTAVQEAMVGKSFRTTLEGPVEIRNLSANFSSLVEELESLVQERTAELAEARDEALLANQAKSIFLTNIGHELRTPLNAIIGYSELWLEEIKGVEEHASLSDGLTHILGSGTHLLKLINGVLDISKIEAGTMELELNFFDVGQLLESVRTTVLPMAAENGNRLEFQGTTGMGLMQADLAKIRQILLNLLGNACKFTRDGRIDLEARRESVEDSEWIIFSVRDTGIGIESKAIEHLFQPFVQMDDSSTREYSGTGLGLAISRHFCRMQNGDIEVSSQLGQGSVFTVRLPSIVNAELVDSDLAEKLA